VKFSTARTNSVPSEGCKSHCLRHLAVRCSIEPLAERFWEDAAKSGKLRAVFYRLGPRTQMRLMVCGSAVEDQESHIFRFGTRRLRVKNAGCNEDVAVESTEF
jgi:hypothetical protein